MVLTSSFSLCQVLFFLLAIILTCKSAKEPTQTASNNR